jgi:hypothetical protein
MDENKTNGGKKILQFIGLAYALIYLSFFAYDEIENGPVAEKVKQSLESEFKLIEPLPGSKLVSYNSSSKPHIAGCGATYNSKKSIEEIKYHYDEQLIMNGWAYQGIEKVKGGGEDLGGKSIRYCKDDKSAAIQYAGENADYGWTYGVSFSWGLGYCNYQQNSSSKKMLIRFGSFFTFIAFIVIGSFLLFLPKDKMVRYVFRRKSEDDFKDQVAFKVFLVLYRIFGIVGIVVGSIVLKETFF